MCGACTFPLPQVALSLRLAAAKSLRRMGKLDEAETHFKVLAGGHLGPGVADAIVQYSLAFWQAYTPRVAVPFNCTHNGCMLAALRRLGDGG